MRFFALLGILLWAFGFTFWQPAGAQVSEAYKLSRTAYDLGRSFPDSSIAIAKKALTIAQQAGNVQEEVRARTVLGRSMILKSDLAGLRYHVSAGFVLLPKVTNDTLISDLYNLASLNYRFSHLPDSALYALQQAEKYARKGKMTTQLSNALLAKAVLLSDKRKYAEALSAYEECYELDTKKGDVIGQALDLQNIGLTLSHLRLNDAALKTFKKAIPLSKSHEDNHGYVRLLVSIAGIYTVKQQYDSADKSLTEAYQLASAMGDNLAQGAIANNLSTNAYERNLLQQTRYWARKSINHYYATGDSVRAASSLGNLGEAERTEGNLAEAQLLLEKSVAYSRILGEEKVLAQSMKMLAKVYQAKGMYAQAADLALQYVNKQDTLYKNNLADEVASIEGRHETFVKDQQIALLHRNVEVQNLSLREKDLLVERRTLLGAILALALIGIFGFYYFYTKRKQLLKEADYQRRLLEEQQERHAAALAAENAERKRIARELHDGVGQMIASVRLHMAARATPTNTYTDLETMLAETSNEVRFISHNLMPQALERKGFDAAIEEFCERLSRTKKIEVVSHVEPVGEQLTPDRAQMLYRVLQELVSNVLKHAQAKTVYVTLTIDGDEVCLTVEDDGVGFDQQQPTESGIGLENLKDRVASVGGQLDVDAKLGRGSLFSIRVGAVSIQSEHRTAYV